MTSERSKDGCMWEGSVNSKDGNGGWPLYLSVGLVSMSVLMLEIGLTRIFSLIFDYHYGFLSVSLAILGLGGGGIFVHEQYERIVNRNLDQKILPVSSGLMAISIMGMTVSLVKIPFLHQVLYAAVLFFFPFFFAGIFLSAAFRQFPLRSHRLYAADLIGASLGSVSIVALLKLGGINANLVAALIGSLPAGLLILGHPLKKVEKTIGVSLIAGLLGTFLVNLFTLYLGEVPLGKGHHKEMLHLLAHPTSMAKVIDSRWSAFGRTDLVADEMRPNEMFLFIDGTAGTMMYRFDGDLKSLERLGFSDFSEHFPFELLSEREKEKVLTIGSGGGGEVLVSLLGGAREITVVEVNRDLVDLVRKYSDFNGGIYSGFPGVKVIVEEGRNFVRRTQENYDIIMLVIPVTKTSRSPEGFALTESFLFTVESINDYLNRLNPNGRLVVVAHSDLEIFRLIFTSLAALKTRGIDTTAAMKHIYTVGPERFPVFVLKKSPLTPEEAQRVHEKMHRHKYSTHSSFIPFVEQAKHTISMGQGIYFEQDMLNQSLYLMAKGEVSPEGIIEAASHEIKAVTDNDPFFYKFDRGIPPIILLLLAFSLIAMGLGWLVRPGKTREGETPQKSMLYHNVLFLVLFSFLGMGFMLIEIPLMQKFVLFLGQPVYSMVVLLFSLLIGAGIGSWASGSFWKGKTISKLRVAAIMVGGLVGMYILSLQQVFALSLGAPFYARVLISFALLSPLGFFMGIPFPQGLKLLGEMGFVHYVPRMWGINGIGSVLGSALAIALAISFGFSYAMILGATLYGFIFILFSLGFRPANGQPSFSKPEIENDLKAIL